MGEKDGKREGEGEEMGRDREATAARASNANFVYEQIKRANWIRRQKNELTLYISTRDIFIQEAHENCSYKFLFHVEY